MFTKFIRLALAISLMLGGGAKIKDIHKQKLEKQYIVGGKVFRIGALSEKKDMLPNMTREIENAKKAFRNINHAANLIEFEDALRQPDTYACVVRKGDGKFYIKRFVIHADRLGEPEEIGSDIEFLYVDRIYEGSLANAKCFAVDDIKTVESKDELMPFPGNNMEEAKRAFLEENNSKLVSLDGAKKKPGTYIGIIDAPSKYKLIEFKVDAGGSFGRIGPDVEFVKPPKDDTESSFTLLPSKIVRGCFKGADIEQAKLAIREDRDLVPFEKIELNVLYWCAIKDEAGNFYMARFMRINHQILQIGEKIPLDWKFLQKIDEMTCDVEWRVTYYEAHTPTCLKVDTNDLETAINKYVSAIAVGKGLICVNNGLPDGIYIKEDMIFKRAGGKRDFVKRIAIKVPERPHPLTSYRPSFYSYIKARMTSDDDKARLDQLVQTRGQRMFAELRVPNFLNPDVNLSHIDVLNLDLISTSNSEVIWVSWPCLDPNAIEVKLITSFQGFDGISSNSRIFKNPDNYLKILQHHSSGSIQSPQTFMHIITYVQQKFILANGAILYMDAQGQIFFYYNLDYLLKKHTRSEINASNERLIRNFNLAPFPRT